LAGRLVASGLPRDKVVGFFRSPDLVFSASPMETKLRELFGILFRSDLTKAVQEDLWRLGYDVSIDGRMGSVTRTAIRAFQRDNGLPQDGRPTDALAKRLKALTIAREVRDLSQYKPPPSAPPSRSATHRQFTNDRAIGEIRSYYLADLPIFQSMEARYGVPGPLVASIMWIETGYGRFFGKSKAAYSLASMAASADYGLVAPRLGDIDAGAQERAFLVDYASQRGDWAFGELRDLLIYAWDNRLDPASFPGSIYGAIGYGQFMPSNIKKFAVDGDGDGRVDLFNKADAVFSVANYLSKSGWRGEMPDEESRRKVIMLYNRSGIYVNTVLYVAQKLSY
jgi:membrane-bound lytic murein transglycosylase B